MPRGRPSRLQCKNVQSMPGPHLCAAFSRRYDRTQNPAPLYITLAGTLPEVFRYKIHAFADCRRRRWHQVPAPVSPSALPYNVPLTIPEPIPEASALPEEPPLRSEQIDLTLSIKRCRTWQDLRRLYWTNRTRHGVVNVVSYFTRLAALLPDLPELLGEEMYDTAATGGTLNPSYDDDDELDAGGDAAAGAVGFRAKGGGGGGGGGGSRGRPAAVAVGANAAARAGAGNAAESRHRQQQQRQRQRQCSLAERTALRQLVVRLVYDACIFTEDHVAAGRLEEALRNPSDPWDTEAYALYLTECDNTKLRCTGAGERAGVVNQLQDMAPPNRDRHNQQLPPQGQQQTQQRPGAPALPSPLTFWDWVRDRPELWSDPIEADVLRGLRHWDAPGREPSITPATSGGGKTWASPAAATPAAAVAESAQRKRVPLCYGPLEITTLAWAAARLQIHRAVPQHAAWLIYDIVHGSYRQMPELDGRQLAQLAYSLAQLGPCVPPGRWRRRFLAATRQRMGQMDPQSLANLAHSLEPLQLVPDPAWLQRFLAVSGPLLEADRLSGAELTQLAWAVFSLRKRLCRVRCWANELLQVSRTVVEYGSGLAVHPASSCTLSPSSSLWAPSRSPSPNGANAASASGAVTAPLLEFLPSLLAEVGAPLPLARMRELQQLLLPVNVPTPSGAAATTAETHGPAAVMTSHPTNVGNIDNSSYVREAAGRVPGSGTELDAVEVGNGAERWVSDRANPWVTDHATALLLGAVAGDQGDGGGGGAPHCRLAIWLLRQPPIVFLLMRLWVDSTRAVKALDSEVGRKTEVGSSWMKQQQLDANGEEEEEEEDVDAQLKELEAGLMQAQSIEAAFDFTTYVSRYLRAVGTPSKAAVPDAGGMAAPATIAMAPPGAAGKEPEPPATSLAAAAVASTSAFTATAAMQWQPPPLLQRQPHRAAFLHPPPSFSSFSSPLMTPPPSSMLSVDSPGEPPISGMAEVSDDVPTESTPMLLMLHTRCWPSTHWLEALAAAATAQLYTPGFR
ncbi:hypothetical protein VaNZ11_004987, partial [Volvox africanus]